MRLILLTALTMLAFAANSILNRAALAGGEAGPASFAALRLVSGAVVLCLLVALRDPGRVRRALDAGNAGALALYVLGFSFAYVSLDAGVGALILFGGVQVTMFAGALIGGEPVPRARWLGAGVALAGLGVLVWPGTGVSLPLSGVALMLAAAVGWGLYSLRGRGGADPLATTAASFLLAVPAGLLVFLLLPDGMSPVGAALAVTSGAMTSGLGYALWYTVLPGLGATRAAVAQLSVPLIAAAGGLALGEALSGRLVVAAVLVLGGVGLSLRPGR
ncbi:DMT family transporter [Aliiroseovarius sp.]|uniref:DMT family transporter n=1 Tax=Aliiroseovarius sp. TaxID=1872442 RepID=UPI002615B565|nr:DMT family transporter [Aliiroseovarius sp.]